MTITVATTHNFESEAELLEMPRRDFMENVESAKRYCLRNGLKPGKSSNVETGLIDDTRYFVRTEPDNWEVASHLTADAFMDQYDFPTPEIDYVDGEIFVSSLEDPAVPVESFRKEFKAREIIPNLLQSERVLGETVADSFFVHLAGGGHDIGGNTVLTEDFAYPIDFQHFGKNPAGSSLYSFIDGEGNCYPETLFERYRQRLGFNMNFEEMRSHVSDRAESFDPEKFWSKLQENTGDVDSDTAESVEKFGENTMEYVENLEEI